MIRLGAKLAIWLNASSPSAATATVKPALSKKGARLAVIADSSSTNKTLGFTSTLVLSLYQHN